MINKWNDQAKRWFKRQTIKSFIDISSKNLDFHKDSIIRRKNIHKDRENINWMFKDLKYKVDVEPEDEDDIQVYQNYRNYSYKPHDKSQTNEKYHNKNPESREIYINTLINSFEHPQNKVNNYRETYHKASCKYYIFQIES